MLNRRDTLRQILTFPILCLALAGCGHKQPASKIFDMTTLTAASPDIRGIGIGMSPLVAKRAMGRYFPIDQLTQDTQYDALDRKYIPLLTSYFDVDDDHPTKIDVRFASAPKGTEAYLVKLEDLRKGSARFPVDKTVDALKAKYGGSPFVIKASEQTTYIWAKGDGSGRFDCGPQIDSVVFLLPQFKACGTYVVVEMRTDANAINWMKTTLLSQSRKNSADQRLKAVISARAAAADKADHTLNQQAPVL